ncbi:hypothetical protein QQ045_007096 [Rhodiola kirilowii]
MGRDYWNWTGRRATGGGGRGGGGDCSDVTTSAGCMSCVFRFLDFHPFQVCYSMNHINQPHHAGNPDIHSSTTSLHHESLQGLEAPRNSSESESSCSISKPNSQNVSIPQISKIQVKTKRRATNIPSQSATASSDELSSPGSRTPSLVARLMGLDLLPEASSPASSSTKLHTHRTRKDMKVSGTQSLPDSPRISLTTLSDVDLHHRLSLQVNKESSHEICKRREIIKSLVQKSEAEGWSPKHYAKQIVKESLIGRSVGLTDITNTVRNRRDEHLLASSLSNNKSFRSSGDGENEAPTVSSNTQQNMASSKLTEKKRMKPFSEKPVQVEKIKCRKAVEDRFKFTNCYVADQKKKPLFVTPSSPSTVNQNHHKNMSKKITPLATDLRMKKKIHPATRTNLDRIQQESDKRQRTNSQSETHINIEAKTQTVGGPEIQYLTKILKCMGIGNHTRISNITNWFSPSNPLNPSIFDLLEPISSSTLNPKCNRQLIFQLADEFLADVLRTYDSVLHMMNGAQLVKLLTSKMASLPLSNCQDLNDVDALVGSDYKYKPDALDDERESVVREVEREILDCLLAETTSLCLTLSR